MKKIYTILLLAALCFGNMQAETLKIGENDSSQKNAPVYGSDADRYQYHNQFIYSASELTALNGQQITGIAFYQKSTYNKPSKDFENVQISLIEVNQTTFESTDFISTAGAQVVFTGSLPASTTTDLVLTLSSEFVYNGGNLLVDVQKTQPSGGGYTGSSWKGFQATAGTTYTVLYGAGTTSGLPSEGFRSMTRPDIQFTYEEAPASGCAAVGVPVASDITATSAKLTWEKAGEVEDYQFECVRKGVEPTWAAAAQKLLTVTLDTLKANTEYDFYVRAYCGAGEGEQGKAAKVSFKTDLSCYAPTLLGVVEAETTSTTAKVTWHASGKGETTYQYTYEVWDDEVPDWTNAPTTTETEVTLTGLTPKTAYQVWVRSYCADDDQSEAITELFVTACGAAALPFEEDFSSDIDCWKVITESYYTEVETGWFLFGWQPVPPYQYLITPELQVSAHKVIVEFEYKAHNSNYHESFKLGYSTTTNDETSAFTWSDEKIVDKTTVETYKDTLPAGVKFIAIQCTSNNQYYLYIDNFKVSELPTCDDPTELNVSEVTDNSAKVTWVSEAATFALELKEGEDEWTAINAEITAPSFELTNLKEHTTYQVRVKAFCDNELESEWVESEAFTTEWKPCLVPQQLSVEATVDGGIVTWQAGSDETKWDLRYKATAADAESWALVENLAEATYTITGLEAETEYEVQVKAICNEENKSDWTSSAVFTTLKKEEPTAISNVATKATATKRIVNGQLIIERNGEQYNAQGVNIK